MHKTLNLDDGYMGSSSIVKSAIDKYGIDSFKKDVLHIFDNFEDMSNKEKELVNEQFVSRSDTYNVKTGGIGSFYHINSIPTRDNYKLATQAMQYKLGNDPEYRKSYCENKKNIAIRLYKEGILVPPSCVGRKHSKDSKDKMSKSQIGSKNSQFGTCWVYKEATNKKIKLSELPSYLEDGWLKGRNINKGL